MKKIALITALLATAGAVGVFQLAWAADGSAPVATPPAVGSVLDTSPTAAPQYPRSNLADSTLSGGSAVIFPNAGQTVVNYPDPCVANPSLSGCATPPPEDTSGGAGTLPSDPPPADPVIEPDTGHCGVPADWGKNADPDCVATTGGWQCYYSGTGTIYYQCP